MHAHRLPTINYRRYVSIGVTSIQFHIWPWVLEFAEISNAVKLPALIVFNSLPWIWVVLSVPAVKIKIPTKNRDFHFVKRRAIVFEGTTGLEINKKIHSITKICLVLSAV